jgi:hypothetical protein
LLRGIDETDHRSRLPCTNDGRHLAPLVRDDAYGMVRLADGIGVKTFPILESCIRRCREQHFHSPLVVSFDLVKRHEKQAMANHSQTVERLAERGGLSWLELLLVLTDMPLYGEYADRFKGKSEGEIFRVVSNVLMHEFSAAYAS